MCCSQHVTAYLLSLQNIPFFDWCRASYIILLIYMLDWNSLVYASPPSDISRLSFWKTEWLPRMQIPIDIKLCLILNPFDLKQKRSWSDVYCKLKLGMSRYITATDSLDPLKILLGKIFSLEQKTNQIHPAATMEKFKLCLSLKKTACSFRL